MKLLNGLEKEKTGVFSGLYAVNPLTGKEIPIWIADYVLITYGTGAIMAVPAHDERDFEFAKKYNLPIIRVVEGKNGETGKIVNPEKEKVDQVKIGKGIDRLMINSGIFNGLLFDEAMEKTKKYFEKKGWGKIVVNFKLKDWGISRQRYWGTPIPIIHCAKCGIVPVFEKDLPVVLPMDVKFGKGNPLETNEKWLNVKCPKCNGKARREAETMDTFVNSSWYFLRYCDSKNDKEIFDKKKVDYWCPIDVYIGGAEHACMHLIYFRFYTKFLRDLGLLKFGEPAKKLFHQGMLHAEGGEKMSKSKPETCVLPEDVSKKYGMDTARFFLCGLASPDKDIDWSENGIVGSLRFVNKIFEFVETAKFEKTSDAVEMKLNKVIKNMINYFETFEYRKASIELRELFDEIQKGKVSREDFGKFLKMLNPICPHITEEFWEKIGGKGFISNSEWPKYEEKKIVQKKESVDLNKKYAEFISEILKKVESNDEITRKIYVYAVPFEVSKIDEKKLSKILSKDVRVFAVNDKNKYDPQNKSKKSLPGMPGVYLE